MDSNFRLFCRGATDRQLLNIIRKEFEGKGRDSSRESDYEAACAEAESRGMRVDREKGMVI